MNSTCQVSFCLSFSFVCLFLKFSLFPSCKWVATGSKFSRRNYKRATEKRAQKDMQQEIFIRAGRSEGKGNTGLSRVGWEGLSSFSQWINFIALHLPEASSSCWVLKEAPQTTDFLIGHFEYKIIIQDILFFHIYRAGLKRFLWYTYLLNGTYSNITYPMNP